MQQKIRRAIARVEVRNRIVVLIESDVVAVQTKVDIEASIAVVVGDGSVGECSLGLLHELEGVALEREPSISLVEKEQRPGCADY